GKHQYPSDIRREGMLYGKIVRPISYGAKLVSANLEEAKAMPGVVVVQDQEFLGVAAPTAYAAGETRDAIAKAAEWDAPPHVASSELYEHLRKTAGVAALRNPLAETFARGAEQFKATYLVPYVQHAPMEPRTAVAEWNGGKLTVWTATQNPFAVRSELAR